MKEYKPLLLVVHGGDSSGKRQNDYIETRQLTKNEYGIKNGSPIWTETLEYNLADKFEILAFEFPTSWDALYGEWLRFFEQILEEYRPYRKEIVLVGHSLGTTFLQQYLVENDLQSNFKLKILGLHLVGCCLIEGDFEINPQWTGLSNIDNIHIYHSVDDPICPYSNAIEFKKNLAQATLHTFEGCGHFDQHRFVELEENIKNTKILN